MFFKTQGRFSVISHLRALPFDEMTEKRPLVLKKTSLITYYLIYFISEMKVILFFAQNTFLYLEMTCVKLGPYG